MQSQVFTKITATASVTRCNSSCNLSRNGVTRQVAGRLQRVTCPFLSLSRYFFGLATITQSKLVLRSAVFLATCLTAFEKEIHCRLQKSCYALQSRAATCNGFKTIHAVIAKSRTELYLVQSLQAPSPPTLLRRDSYHFEARASARCHTQHGRHQGACSF